MGNVDRPIGIIGAMEVEIELLVAKMGEHGKVKKRNYAGTTFNCGTIEGVDVVVVRSGVGMVNAALCVQILVSDFHASCIINTGVAGSLDSAIDIGDVVVASDAVNHVMDVSNLGYQPGQNPDYVFVGFPASKELAEKALSAAGELWVKAHKGRVASGDVFVHTQEQKDYIRSQFKASCCEMEGAAIAQACYVNRIPYLILRAISDKADGSSTMDYPTFEALAARTCAGLTVRLLGMLP